MDTVEFCRQMPKVELHVHLEGSIRPETVLALAEKNHVSLPATTVEGLKEWYEFRDFSHFVDVYVAVSKCLKTADDLEFITREFLESQAEQNVLHTEITFTASTIEQYCGIPWEQQLRAIGRAREYGLKELDVSCGFILDVVRGDPMERALEVVQWSLRGREFGVCALGLAGDERLGLQDYPAAFALAHDAGLPIAAHAGETVGPESIREAIEVARPKRIGHGVRCVEDPFLIRELWKSQIPLEVCPTSNVRLGVFPSISEHSLPKLLDEGLYVTINSDDPPMFGTTLTDEFIQCALTFDLSKDVLWTLNHNAAKAAFVDAETKLRLLDTLREEFSALDDEEESQGE